LEKENLQPTWLSTRASRVSNWPSSRSGSQNFPAIASAEAALLSLDLIFSRTARISRKSRIKCPALAHWFGAMKGAGRPPPNSKFCLVTNFDRWLVVVKFVAPPSEKIEERASKLRAALASRNGLLCWLTGWSKFVVVKFAGKFGKYGCCWKILGLDEAINFSLVESSRLRISRSSGRLDVLAELTGLSLKCNANIIDEPLDSKVSIEFFTLSFPKNTKKH